MTSEKTRECPACALEGPADADVCPYCGYEFPGGPSRSLIWVAVVMALLLAWPLFRVIRSLL